jgi:putative flippase GtrA
MRAHTARSPQQSALAGTCAAIENRARRLAAGVPQLSRYTAASVLALACDFAVYLALATGGMTAALAGVAGYGAGMVVHYLLSVAVVFDARAANKAPARLMGEFLLTGLAGLALTGVVIALATGIGGLPLLPAKVAATVVSFLAVYALRRGMVFAARA